MPRYTIVLAGGRSSRMGRDKGGLTLAGRSLIAHAVAACADWGQVVVVAAHVPADVDADSVVLAREDPPFGGPVAGLAAALAALPNAQPTDEILLLACDLPRVDTVVALLANAPLGPDGTCLVDAANVPQLLSGRYRRAALAAALPDDPRNAAIRTTLGRLDLHLVPAGELADDVDTPAQAAAAGLD